jgi:hypothetical protein
MPWKLSDDTRQAAIRTMAYGKGVMRGTLIVAVTAQRLAHQEVIIALHIPRVKEVTHVSKAVGKGQPMGQGGSRPKFGGILDRRRPARS